MWIVWPHLNVEIGFTLCLFQAGLKSSGEDVRFPFPVVSEPSGSYSRGVQTAEST